MKKYTISISEIAEDGTTICSTWLVKSDLAARLRIGLTVKYGDAPTNQMFSANAINEAVTTLPVVEL